MTAALYSVPDVAAYFGRSRGIIMDHVHRYGLGRKVGRTWILTEADIEIIRIHATGKVGRPRKEQTT